ncbi:hypothetical protein C8Q77DRAFT_1159762 [Trametes polyzona]|nr:hypothetical protein C8Q77DRAFT_1159762 [Trametes polyzona]
MSSAIDVVRPSEHDLLRRLQTIDEMIRVNEETERRLQRIAERRRIPPVPDLRFEYSYVRSVAPYVHIEQPSSAKGKEKAIDGVDGLELDTSAATTAGQETGEVVRVEWGRILWITTRDQVISPLLQGALWGVASHFLRPLGAVLGAHFRAWWARGAARGKDASEIEGDGVQWLRNWMGSILTPSVPSVVHSSRLH